MLSDLNDVTQSRNSTLDLFSQLLPLPLHWRVRFYLSLFYHFPNPHVVFVFFHPQLATTSRFTNISQSKRIRHGMEIQKQLPNCQCMHSDGTDRMLKCVGVFGKRNTIGIADEILPYLSRRSNLAGTNFTKSTLAQHSVHPECLVRDWLTFQELPLQVPQEIHRILELLEGDTCQERLHLPAMEQKVRGREECQNVNSGYINLVCLSYRSLHI